MVTDRDMKALAFLEQFRTATAAQIDRIAYQNIKVAWKRLAKLHKDRLIYRTDNTLSSGYVYSANRIRSVKQFRHDNIRNEFYLKLLEVSEVEEALVETQFGAIRPDLLVTGSYRGKPYFLSVEVETVGNHSPINYEKYNNYFLKEWKTYFNERPLVVYVTDKPVNPTKHYDSIHINAGLDNFIDVFQ